MFLEPGAPLLTRREFNRSKWLCCQEVVSEFDSITRRAVGVARGFHLLTHRSSSSIYNEWHSRPRKRNFIMETLLQTAPVFAAIGYSLVYLLAGGGVFGAFV